MLLSAIVVLDGDSAGRKIRISDTPASAPKVHAHMAQETVPKMTLKPLYIFNGI